MNEGDCYYSPLFESSSGMFLDNLLREDGYISSAICDSFQNDMYPLENNDKKLLNEISNYEESRNIENDLSLNSSHYSYGISYQNKGINNSQSFMFNSDLSDGIIDSISLPNSNCVSRMSPSSNTLYSNRIQSVNIQTLHNHVKSKGQDTAERRNQHNISEKRRIERINNCINELYHLLELSGVCIRRSKVTILSEVTKKILHLEQAVKELKQKVNDAEIVAHRVLKEPSCNPHRSSVNYHVMFLQHPIPQAILSADGQFIDANSQFCSLTQKTVQQLREMTLFKFASIDDLPCAFSSYSNILRTDNNTEGVYMFRHCYLSDCCQPVFFSLSVVRNDQNQPTNFVYNILPVVACTCTDNNMA